MAEGIGHRGHDRIAIAATIDAGMTLPSWLAACLACTGLRTDLLAIRAAIPSAARPTRRRDYRLTTGDATRLRRPAWRRAIGTIGTSRDAISRPLAASLTALGMVGLLIGAVPAVGGSFGLPAGGGAASASQPVEERAPAAIPTEVDAVTTAAGGRTDATTARSDPGSTTPLSLLLLTTGATLFGVRRLTSRLGPLR